MLLFFLHSDPKSNHRTDITVTLTFLRSTADADAIARINKSTESLASQIPTLLGSQKIDTHAPLALYSSKALKSPIS